MNGKTVPKAMRSNSPLEPSSSAITRLSTHRRRRLPSPQPDIACASCAPCLLGSLEANIAAGKPVPGLCLAIAAWMYYVGGIDQTGQPIDVKDPMAEKLRAISDASTTPADKVAALLSLSEIFPTELAENLKAPVTEAAEFLWAQGARQAALQVVT